MQDEGQTLLAMASDWAKAMVTNDAELIGSFMDDEWVIVSERGISSKEEFLSFVRSGQLTHSTFEMPGEPRIRFYGETAVLTGRVVNTAHFDGAIFNANEWTSDVFVKRNGAWLCVLSHITPAQDTGDKREDT